MLIPAAFAPLREARLSNLEQEFVIWRLGIDVNPLFMGDRIVYQDGTIVLIVIHYLKSGCWPVSLFAWHVMPSFHSSP